MTTQFDAGTTWILILVLGLGTFAFRLSFIQLYAYLGEPSQEVKHALGLIPAAVLAALISPVLFPLENAIIGTFINIHAIAGAGAAVVAWRTRSILGTIVVGMLVLWSLQFLLG